MKPWDLWNHWKLETTETGWNTETLKLVKPVKPVGPVKPESNEIPSTFLYKLNTNSGEDAKMDLLDVSSENLKPRN